MSLGLLLGANASWASEPLALRFGPGLQVAQASMDDLFEAEPAAPAESATAAPTPAAAATGAAASAESLDALFEGPAQSASPAPAKTPAPATTPAGEAASAESLDALFDAPAPAATAAPAPATATTAAPASDPLAAAEPAPGIVFSGLYQNEFAYAVPDEGHISSLKQLLKLRLNGTLNARVKWQIGGDFEYDPVFQLGDYYNKQVKEDQLVFGYVDETYLDIDADAWEFRLGRQHIIWGEMVGLFFADVISPIDLRESILPDFDLIRIPQWAARAEYFSGDFHGELVFIPLTTIDNVGVYGAEYYPYPISLPPGVKGIFLEDKAPRGDFGADLAAGARASYLLNGWDLSAFYYTSPDKTAALSRTLNLGVDPTVTFKPVHGRIHQIGSTLAKDFGVFVLKAEAIETLDRLLNVDRLSDGDGLVKTDTLTYVAGIDWAGETGHNVNLQFFQTWLQNYDPAMQFKDLESGASILLTTSALHPDITPEVLWIRSLDRNEWLLESKITWEFAADWRATLGTDIFAGPPTSLFGQFDHTNRVYTEFRHNF
ncbi:MAG: hypothetical protein EXR83_15875 [Gammaproteobacteria bacterium]|nr:hypothetical protein [Gammaproteobacteria bacterium]